MIAEAEAFSADDAAARLRVDTLNGLSTYVYGLRAQIGDEAGLGGKLGERDKRAMRDAAEATVAWADMHGTDATTDEIEARLAELRAVVDPITTALYASGGDATDGEHVRDEL
jgi:heat shock protein 5